MSASTFAKANPNSGMLAGFQCPECSSFGPFEIEEATLVTYFDHDFGCQEYLGWTGESYCRCPKCSHEGCVGDFQTDEGGGA